MAKSPKLIELHKLPSVADCVKVAQKFGLRDNYRSATIVGVKAQAFGILQILIEEEMHVVLLIIDKAKR